MIYVANDAGSREFLPAIERAGCPAELRNMPAADFAFSGNGPDEDPIAIGIERKTINELTTFEQNRLSRQAPRMARYYERSYLIVEGQYGCRADGTMVWFKNGSWVPVSPGKSGSIFHYSFVDNYLNSLAEFTGIRVKKSDRETETVRIVAGLYKWWQKPYEEHAQTLGYDPSLLPPIGQVSGYSGKEDKALRLRVGMIERLEGVGPGTAIVLAHRWETPKQMVLAEEEEWLIPKVIGKNRARDIRRQLWGEEL